MSIHYGTYEFIADSEFGDLKGEFRSKNGPFETTGKFELNPAHSMIHFDFNNTQKSFEFHL